MSNIRIMPAELANKIAAGEVVERPASVVKELVENAIDAKSSSIRIEIEEAGLKSIRVIDSGIGMNESDAKLAFKRHATSKIKDEKDLFRILTLGFRGEALPSISAVSEVVLKTSDGLVGTSIKLTGGKIVESSQSDLRQGTDILISNLFYNTPARLKYVRSLHTELGHITDYINRIALSHPNIAISLKHNDKILLQTDGSNDLLKVIANIYGIEAARKMVNVEFKDNDFNITGYISKPELSRASRNYITIIVNGRTIKNYSIIRSINDGYHTLLPKDRYPLVVLDIQMDSLLVDVNVHPSKLEVRFSKEKELKELISNSIKNELRKLSFVVNVENKPKKEILHQESFTLERDTKLDYSTLDISDIISTDLPSNIKEYTILENDYQDTIQEPVINNNLDNNNDNDYLEFTEKLDIIDRFPTLEPIGQLHGTYILAQNENGLYIIDQHAAQERIKYEFFYQKLGESKKEVKSLLIPFTLEYPLNEFLIIKENIDILNDMGLELYEFGINSYIVKSHPNWFPSGKEEEVIDNMIEELLNKKNIDLKKLREEAAIMMSCKLSIKANHNLTIAGMEKLLDDIKKCDNPFTCPHGRPIVIHYSTYELEKLFKRVM